MSRFLFSLFFIQMLWGACSAQSICISAGVNRSKYVNKAPLTSHNVTGFEIGTGVRLKLKNSFYLEPSLRFISKGIAVNSVTIDSLLNYTSIADATARTYNIEALPVVNYMITKRFSIGLYPYASYIAAASLNAHIIIYENWHSEQQKVIRDYVSHVDNPASMFNRFDYGFGLKTGVTLYSKINLEAGFERGLASIDRSFPGANNLTIFLLLNFTFHEGQQ